MSVDVTVAVERAGPRTRGLRQLLGALAFTADDFGFAAPRMVSLAAKMPCSVKTVERQMAALELEGWVTVYRDVLDGKGNVYLIDLKKLGYEVADLSKAKRGAWWPEARRRLEARGAMPAIASREQQVATVKPEGSGGATRGTAGPGSDQIVQSSAENPFFVPEVTRQNGGVHPTKQGGSPDKNVIPIRKNEERRTKKNKYPLPPCSPEPQRKTGPETERQERERATARANATAHVRESGTGPQRKAAGSGGAASETDEAEAVAIQTGRVLGECGLSDGRLGRAVAAAIRLELDRRAEGARRGEREAVCDPEAEAALVATAMCANWREFRRVEGMLRYPVGPRKFFAHGLAMGRCWPPVDHERAKRAQRIAVGR